MKTSPYEVGINENDTSITKITGIFRCKLLEGVENIFESRCWFLK